VARPLTVCAQCSQCWARQNYQYLLFAAEPYETVAFKLQAREIDVGPGRLLVHWDRCVPLRE